jgi:hypothetical protein
MKRVYGYSEGLWRGGLILLLVLCVCLPAAADTIVGSPPNVVVVGSPPDNGTGNCIPFGCAFNGEFQQVYTSDLFTGPLTITWLDFFNTQFDNGATGMNTGTFTISLSTTTANWNSLDPNPANNIGPDSTVVFSGSLAQPWAMGQTLFIPFSAPFTYTPAAGSNLLLDIVATGTDDPQGLIYFDTNGSNNGKFNGNNVFGRLVIGTLMAGTTNELDAGYGLETGFGTGGLIPEPGPMSLMGGGLAAMAIARVRRRRK